MIINNFHFSTGNRKIGVTLNFNLMPGTTCNPDAPCMKHGCYAMRDMKRYKSCYRAWSENTDLLMNKHEYKLFIESFCEAIDTMNCRFVRLHSAGDIFSVEYLDALCKVAKRNRSVKFMTYTKQFDVLKKYTENHKIPSNFKIYLSFWNEFQASPELASNFQIAYYNDWEHETLIDWDSSFTCPGECPKCKFKCWKTKDNVVFNKH